MSDPVTPLDPRQALDREQKAVHEPYAERVLVALDEDINVDTDGLPDETISSRWARWSTMGGIRGVLGRAGSGFLNLFQKDHGANAELGDLARAEKLVATEEATPTVRAEE